MAKQPRRQPLKLRRTLTRAGAQPGSAPRLARALWGVTPAAARRAIDQQEQALAAQSGTLEQQLATERARIGQLQADGDQLKRRLKALRNTVDILRDKLAHERAARAVLATRLLDRQAEDDKALKAAAAARMEQARVGADIRQEHEALRQLVAALYRSIAGRQGVPTGLEVLTEVPAVPRRTAGISPHAQWQRFLMGKKSGRTLTAADGRVILHQGETIGPDELAAAEQEGLLFELILTAKVVERLPDL